MFFKFDVGDIPSDSGHTGSSLDGKTRAFAKQHIKRRRSGKMKVEAGGRRESGGSWRSVRNYANWANKEIYRKSVFELERERETEID